VTEQCVAAELGELLEAAVVTLLLEPVVMAEQAELAVPVVVVVTAEDLTPNSWTTLWKMLQRAGPDSCSCWRCDVRERDTQNQEVLRLR